MGIISRGEYPLGGKDRIAGRSRRIIIVALTVSCVSILLMEMAGDELRSFFYRKSEPLFFGVKPELAIDTLIGVIVVSLTVAVVIGVKQTIRSNGE
jgi:hypothetical protein